MNTELQNKVWSILPKEFKEEVKKEYYDCKHCNADACAIELETVFGKHNLTSDTEGEEILTVSRKEVRSIYDHAIGLITKTRTEDENYKLAMLEKTLMEELFGSKCLPDEDAHEDNFVESVPKNEGTHQEQCVSKNAESGTHSFNHNLKDDFHDHDRLHIAAMAMQGILANSHQEMVDMKIDKVAELAIETADALITEYEKGGEA